MDTDIQPINSWPFLCQAWGTGFVFTVHNKSPVPPELSKDIWDTHKVMGIFQLTSRSVPW